MYVNGDEILAAHPYLKAQLKNNHKLKDDPQVSRVVRWLRRYSLDELPQLINKWPSKKGWRERWGTSEDSG